MPDEILRALELAIQELEELSDLIGADGYFTRAKHIKIDVLPVLRDALSSRSVTGPEESPLKMGITRLWD